MEKTIGRQSLARLAYPEEPGKRSTTEPVCLPFVPPGLPRQTYIGQHLEMWPVDVPISDLEGAGQAR